MSTGHKDVRSSLIIWSQGLNSNVVLGAGVGVSVGTYDSYPTPSSNSQQVFYIYILSV